MLARVNALCMKTVGDSSICVKTALIMFEELNAEITWKTAWELYPWLQRTASERGLSVDCIMHEGESLLEIDISQH